MIRLLPLALLALILAACQAQPAQPQSAPSGGRNVAVYRDVSPADLRAMLAVTDPFLLDVHVPNEGYLAGTDARIPYTDVTARAAELPADRDATIVVYCMSGRMSAIAAEDLLELGYRNVHNLAGGMLAWRAAGYEVRPG